MEQKNRKTKLLIGEKMKYSFLMIGLFIFSTAFADTLPPFVDQINPGNGEEGVPVETEITFNIHDLYDGVDLESIAVTMDGILYTKTGPYSDYFENNPDIPDNHDYFINIIPLNYFNYGETVNVQIEASDIAGNVMTPVVYSFVCVEDNRPPDVGNFEPSPLEVDVELDTQVKFEIYDAISGVNISSVSVKINESFPYTISDEGIFSYIGNPSNYTVTITPPNVFESGERIDVEILAQDRSGNTMPAFNYQFYCEHDIVAPYTGEWIPAQESENNLINSNIAFNVYDDLTGVDLETVLVEVDDILYTYQNTSFTYTTLPYGYSIQINPIDDFEYGETINVSLNASDNTGNAMDQTDYTLAFIPDIQPPHLGGLNPGRGATEIPLNTNITFQILDDVSGVDINSLNVTVSVDGNQTEYSVANGNLGYNGNVNNFSITIDPAIDFAYGDLVTVDAVAFDRSNPPNELIDNYSFQCELLDPDPPFVWEFFPEDNAVNIPVDTEIIFYILDSGQGVDIGSLELEVNGQIIPAEDYSAVPVSIYEGPGYLISFAPDVPFVYSENVTIFVAANDFAGAPNEMLFQSQFQCVENTPPNAEAVLVETYEDNSTVIIFSGNDADEQPLTFEVLSDPTDGSYTNGIYIPNQDYYGNDSFTYRANDGLIDSAPATVTITIIPVNDAPILNLPTLFECNEDEVSEVFDIEPYTSQTYGEEDTLSIYAIGTENISVTVMGLNYVTLEAVNENWNGMDDVTFYLSDGVTDAYIVQQLVSVNVIPQNDSPEFYSEPEPEAVEDSYYSYYTNAFDPDGDANLTFAAPQIPDWLSFDADEGLLYGTPANSDVGSHNIVLTVTDGFIQEPVEQIFNIEVMNTNDAPEIFLPDEFTFIEDEELILDFTQYISDIDADDLSLTVSGLMNINADLTDIENVIISANTNWNGYENLVFTVNDHNGRATASDNVTVIVSPANDAPALNLPDNFTFEMNTVFVSDFFPFLADIDGDVLSLSVNEAQNVIIEITGNVVSLIPEEDWIGSEFVTFTALDAEFSAIDSVEIIVTEPVIDLSLLPLTFEFTENTFPMIDLSEFIANYDELADGLLLTIYDNVYLDIEVFGHAFSISAPHNFTGEENITIRLDYNDRETGGRAHYFAEAVILIRVIPKVPEERVNLSVHTISTAAPECIFEINTAEEKDKIKGYILNRRGKVINELHITENGSKKEALWNAKDKNSNNVSGGFYIYKFLINKRVYQGSIIVAR